MKVAIKSYSIETGVPMPENDVYYINMPCTISNFHHGLYGKYPPEDEEGQIVMEQDGWFQYMTKYIDPSWAN